jgi:PDDEXK-like domain of unknown function (DUF3799)
MKNNLTPTTYHADTTHVSNSGLTKLLRSPAHYYQRYLSPDREPFDTAAFKLGRAFHVACSEPETFFDRYIIAPGSIDRRTTQGKQRWAEFEVAAQSRVVLQEKPTQYDTGKTSRVLSYEQVMRMRDSLMAHPIASVLMLQGKAEQIGTWRDWYTDVPCKGMWDWITEPSGRKIVLDFKSCDDASPEGFRRSAWKYGYVRQQEFYTQGSGCDTFVFAAVEKHAPYLCELYTFDVQEQTRTEIITALERYKSGIETGIWPGYNPERKIKILTL